MESKMRVRVMLPEKVLYQGEAEAATLTAFDGEMSIRPNHCQYIQKLADKGKVTLRGTSDGEKKFEIKGGYAEYSKTHLLSICVFEGEEV